MTDDPQFPQAQPRKKLVISFDDEPEAPTPTPAQPPTAPAPAVRTGPPQRSSNDHSLWSNRAPADPPAPVFAPRRATPQPPPPAWPPAQTQPLAPPQWPPPSPAGWSPQPTAPRRDLASWGLRVVATLVDGTISLVVVIVAMLLVGGSVFGLSSGAADGTASAAGVLAAALTYLAVSIVWMLIYAPLLMRREGEHNGQTLGKQLVGIRVVRMDGAPMTAGTAIMRDVVVKNFLIWGLGSFLFSIPGILDSLWPLWDGQRQAWHDKMVSTLVTEA